MACSVREIWTNLSWNKGCLNSLHRDWNFSSGITLWNTTVKTSLWLHCEVWMLTFSPGITLLKTCKAPLFHWIILRQAQAWILKSFSMSPWTMKGRDISSVIWQVYKQIPLPGGLVVKNPPANAGDSRDMGLIPGTGKSPGVGNLLQYSCLGNPMDRGTWRTTVHGVTKSQTQLSN